MNRAGLDKRGLITDVSSNAPAVRAYIRLYEQLCVLTSDREHRFIVVTSATPREGRSTVAANLAICSAYAGQCRTLLMDADCDRPSIAGMFGMEPGRGLHDVVSGSADLDAAIHTPDGKNLSILPAGPGSTSVEITAHARELADKMSTWESRFDWVIADSGPVLSSSGALTLGTHATGVLLVVDASRTRSPVLTRAAHRLREGRVHTLGVVLNRRRHIIPRYAYRWL